MLRPRTLEARRLVDDLRLDLARDLPLQLALYARSGGVPLDEELIAEASADLPDPEPFGDDELHAAVAPYAYGIRPYEAAVAAITALARRHHAEVARFPAPEPVVVAARVEALASWDEVARRGGLASATEARRTLKRAMRRLVPPPNDLPPAKARRGRRASE